MSINKHTLWHSIRTVSTGLFIIGLLPFPLPFMGPVNPYAVSIYFLYLVVTFVGIIIGQNMTMRYKQYADNSNTKKKREKIYGIIGISVILLLFLPFIVASIARLLSQ